MSSGRRPRSKHLAAVCGGLMWVMLIGDLGMTNTARAEDPSDENDEGPLMPHRPHTKLAELFPGEIVDGARCRGRGGRWVVQGEWEGCVGPGGQIGVWTKFARAGHPEWSAIWVQNQLEGKSVRFHENGVVSELGNFVKGKREGAFQGFWNTGALRFEETFVDDKRQGSWKVYHPSGHLELDAGYKDDEVDGNYVGWHRSCHKSKEGRYTAGKQEGLWREWNEKGVLLSEGEYKDGKRVGTWKFYHQPSRALVEEGPYVDGKREGEWTEYFTNGQKFRTVKWKADVREGAGPEACAKVEDAAWFVDFDAREEGCQKGNPPWATRLLMWTGYFEEGARMWERHYDDTGNIDGVEREWHPTGELMHEGQWSRGVPSGVHSWKGADGKVFGDSVISGGTGDWTAYYHTGKPREQGRYENGMKALRWTTWYLNGNKSAEENWARGKKNGQMRWWFESGALKVVGDFRDDNRAGVWTAYWSGGRPAWEGPYGLQGERTGEWRDYYADGTLKSAGPMKDDYENGLWTEYYDNGEKSGEGEYVDGKRQGKWRLWWKTGEFWREAIYERGVEVDTGNDECAAAGGEWVNLPEERVTGCMMCRWDSKTEDEKDVMVGLEEGAVGRQGSAEDKQTPQGGQVNSQVLEAEGGKEAHQTPEDPAGRVIQDPEREWIFWHANGKKEKQGRFIGGKEEGRWSFWYENGSPRLEGTFKDGIEDGLWTGWYEAGPKKFEGQFADGKEVGEWKTFGPDGKPRSAGSYEGGRKTGRWTWYHAGGQVREEGGFVANEEDGLWTSYHVNGRKSGEGSYKAGKREGPWTWWREDGTVWRKAVYVEGKEQIP